MPEKTVAINILQENITTGLAEKLKKDSKYRKLVRVPKNLELKIAVDIPEKKKASFEGNKALKDLIRNKAKSEIETLYINLANLIKGADLAAQDGVLDKAELRQYSSQQTSNFLTQCERKLSEICQEELNKTVHDLRKADEDDVKFAIKMVWHGKEYAMIALGVALTPVTFGASTVVVALALCKTTVTVINDVRDKTKGSFDAVKAATDSFHQLHRRITKLNASKDSLKAQMKNWGTITLAAALKEFTGIDGLIETFASTKASITTAQSRLNGSKRKLIKAGEKLKDLKAYKAELLAIGEKTKDLKEAKEIYFEKLTKITEKEHELKVAISERIKQLEVIEPWTEQLIKMFGIFEAENQATAKGEAALEIIMKLVAVAVSVAAAEPATVVAALQGAATELANIALDEAMDQATDSVAAVISRQFEELRGPA